MLKKFESIDDILSSELPKGVILDNVIIAYNKVNSDKYKRIVCSISGGSDSDDMLDIIWKCDKYNKVRYIWFNTGLEYQATKDHLKELEKKYNIKIETFNAIKSIPLSCKMYGQPFCSKYASEMLSRLQHHGFKFEDESFEILNSRYPKCKIALNWWCNVSGEDSKFNINRNKWLKEFMVLNPPTFSISNKCFMARTDSCAWRLKHAVC